jgi:toxin ParE1/3/4
VTGRFRTEPEASAELDEAALWYEQRRNGLGIEFLEAIDNALAFIGRFPQTGTVVPGVPLDLPVRRIPVRRFPFHVIYLELPDAIQILAFAHDRRSPGYWRSRTVK